MNMADSSKFDFITTPAGEKTFLPSPQQQQETKGPSVGVDNAFFKGYFSPESYTPAVEKTFLSTPQQQQTKGPGEKTFLPTPQQQQTKGPGVDNAYYRGYFSPESYTPAGEKTFLPTPQQQQTKGPDGMNNVYYKGYFSPESFGSYEDVMEALRKPVSSYSLLYEHPMTHKPIQPPKPPIQNPKPRVGRPPTKRKLESTSSDNKLAVVVVTPKQKPASKKNGGENNNVKFPKNVKSLMETRMFDGVPVNYVSLSKGTLLSGIIQGNVYLCGCSLCQYKQTVTASEFERHALGGSKTSHPNNHIRFNNEKTMHEVVKKLHNTPDNMLVDALLTVTGSSINQEAFCAWRESFLSRSQQVVSSQQA